MPDKARVTVTSKRQITLPAALCRDLGIEQGDQLELTWVENELRLRPVPRFAPLTRDSSLFRYMGAIRGPGGSGARDHDRILAGEALGRRKRRD